MSREEEDLRAKIKVLKEIVDSDSSYLNLGLIATYLALLTLKADQVIDKLEQVLGGLPQSKHSSD